MKIVDPQSTSAGVNTRLQMPVSRTEAEEESTKYQSAWERLRGLTRGTGVRAMVASSMVAGCDVDTGIKAGLAALLVFGMGYWLLKLRKESKALRRSFSLLQDALLFPPHVLAMKPVSTAYWQRHVDALVLFASGGSLERARAYAAAHGVDFDAFRYGGLMTKMDGSLLTGRHIFDMLIDRKGFNAAALRSQWESSARAMNVSELNTMLDMIPAGHNMAETAAERGAWLWELEAVARADSSFTIVDMLERIARDRSYFQMLDGIAIPAFLATYYDRMGAHSYAKAVRTDLLFDGRCAIHLLRESGASPYVRDDASTEERSLVDGLLALHDARIHLWWTYKVEEVYRKDVTERVDFLTHVFKSLNTAHVILDDSAVIGDELYCAKPMAAIRGHVRNLWAETSQIWKRDCLHHTTLKPLPLPLKPSFRMK